MGYRRRTTGGGSPDGCQDFTRRRVSSWRSLGPSLLVSAVAPLVTFRLLRPHVSGDAVALVIAAVIPVAWTATRLLWCRRLDEGRRSAGLGDQDRASAGTGQPSGTGPARLEE